ncbi:MAG TPA: twin-arginine translocase TatA/TatE family subunit [Coriobacteriia bacterium]|nr:twin-arginine translocase TatA/TatE family subunit [Coriobacteriia bacterium]
MAVFGLPGGSEWLFILAIVLLLFGPSQLPKLARTFGKSAKALKDGIDGKFEEDEPTDESAAKAEGEIKDESKV